jgi:hypothetical protein
VPLPLGVRAVSKFISVILADLAMVGFAISFLTLARVALAISFLWFFCHMPQDDIEIESIVSHFAQRETGRLEREWGRHSLSHRGALALERRTKYAAKALFS